ncbi:MAG: hypothetical protein ACQETM_01085, partial [Bacteroidota bacterium]
MTWSVFPTVFAISSGFWGVAVASVYLSRFRPRTEALAHLFFRVDQLAQDLSYLLVREFLAFLSLQLA